MVPQPRAAFNPEFRGREQVVACDMLSHMTRTTLILADDVMRRLRRRAADERRTLTYVVERALRLGLDAMASGRRGRVRLPSFDLGPFLLDPARRPADGSEWAAPSRRPRPPRPRLESGSR